MQELDLDSIDHIFMVSGHSFLPCDEDFGLYEKEKRKKEQVYSFGEWIDIAKRARKKSSAPFEVQEMSAASFMNFHEMQSNIVNRKTDTDGCKVQWLNIRWLRFTKSELHVMWFKYSVSEDEAFKSVTLKIRGKGRAKIIPSLSGLLKVLATKQLQSLEARD